jgi:superfamily II DNA or RNA helicase
MLLNSSELDAQQFTVVERGITQTEIYKQHLIKINKLFEVAQQRQPYLEARDYQLAAAAMYCCRPNNMAALSQGLGKTFIATLIAANLYSQTTRPGTVHICIPNQTMLPRWVEDLQLLFQPEEIVFLSNQDLGRTSLPRKQNLIKEAKILIYTHDFPRYRGKSGLTNGRYLLESAPPSLLVIDEIHHLKDSSSLKYLALDPIARRAKRVLGLSGTLTEGDLNCLANILQLIYQKDWVYYRQSQKLQSLFGRSLELGINYATGQKAVGKNKQLNTVNKDKLSDYYNLVRRYIHRLSIDQPEVRAQIALPAANFKAYAVELNLSQADAYQAALAANSYTLAGLQSSTQLSQEGTRYAQTLLQEAIRICNCGVDNLPTPKSKLTVNLTATAKKTVVFCQHVASARFIYEQLAVRWGTDALIRVFSKDPEFSVKTQSPAQRWAAIHKFETDPNIRVGIFSLNLAAEAIDLVAADQIIIYCAPWSGAKFDQCLRRTLRPGNKNPAVEIITIYHTRAIDRYQLQLIEAKQKVGRLLLDYSDSPELENNRAAVKQALTLIS